MTVGTYAERVAAEVRAEAARQRIPHARFARVLGISEMSVSRRLNGYRSLNVDELAAIAAELHVPVEQLLPHLDSNQKPAGERTAAVIDLAEYRRTAA